MDFHDHERPLKLLGPTVDLRFYEDDAAITEYVCKHFLHLMTPLEVRVIKYAGPIVSDSESEKVRKIHEYCESEYGHVDDQDVIEAFAVDRGDYLLQVRNRLLRDHSDEVFINRCPNCSRIVRTPKARQCPWCKHDWHNK